MINISDLNTLEILCSLDETLSNNTIIAMQPDFHQQLIHQATLKMASWLIHKFKMTLSFHLDRVSFLGDKGVHFTLICNSFAQSLFFNIKFDQNGQFEFSSNVDFNADIYIQKEVIPFEQLASA